MEMMFKLILSVMVSTVPAYLQNILIGTATRGNDQEWTNFKLHEPCKPHGLSSGVCVCCSIDPSSVRSLLFVFMCQNLFVDAVHTRGPQQFNTYSRFWKNGICLFTSSPYAMEMMFKLIYMNSI
jgi:hypothetical protein